MNKRKIQTLSQIQIFNKNTRKINNEQLSISPSNKSKKQKNRVNREKHTNPTRTKLIRVQAPPLIEEENNNAKLY